MPFFKHKTVGLKCGQPRASVAQLGGYGDSKVGCLVFVYGDDENRDVKVAIAEDVGQGLCVFAGLAIWQFGNLAIWQFGKNSLCHSVKFRVTAIRVFLSARGRSMT